MRSLIEMWLQNNFALRRLQDEKDEAIESFRICFGRNFRNHEAKILNAGNLQRQMIQGFEFLGTPDVGT